MMKFVYGYLKRDNSEILKFHLKYQFHFEISFYFEISATFFYWRRAVLQ